MVIKYNRNDIYKKSGIYCIKNTINDRVYIGSSNNLYKRFNAHKNGLLNKTHVNKALLNFSIKHGHDSLYVEIVERCSVSELLNKENHYIKIFKAYGHGFNCSPKAEAPNHPIFSQETRYKISQKRKLYILNNPDENKRRLDKGREVLRQKYKLGLIKGTNAGKTASAETRLKQRIAKLGKKSKIPSEVWSKIRERSKAANLGSNSHFSKINERNVLDIKRLIKDGTMLKKDIAKIFNISKSTISDIIAKRSWTHVQ